MSANTEEGLCTRLREHADYWQRECTGLVGELKALVDTSNEKTMELAYYYKTVADLKGYIQRLEKELQDMRGDG